MPPTLDQLEHDADRGDSEASFQLGHHYAFGDPGVRNYDKAFKYLARAAMNRHPKAEYFLGAMFMEGIGVRSNFDEAEKWFRLAKADGDPFADMGIGLINNWRKQLKKQK